LYQPETIYTQVALDTIKFYLDFGKLENFQECDIPEEINSIRRGCFVSLHKIDGELRGCIGTIDQFQPPSATVGLVRLQKKKLII